MLGITINGVDLVVDYTIDRETAISPYPSEIIIEEVYALGAEERIVITGLLNEDNLQTIKEEIIKEIS